MGRMGTIKTGMLLALEVDWEAAEGGEVRIAGIRPVLPRPGTDQWEDLELECMDDARWRRKREG